MYNPFVETTDETSDDQLVADARQGNQDAIERLFLRHQPWVFNIAVRMLLQRADAEDATQDILIKVFTSLSSFRGESKFRTWLYRIVVNHILNLKRKRGTAADSVCSFTDAGRGLRQTPDLDPPDPRTIPVPFEILVEEAKTGCSMGMLLCLDGRQRLVYILGEVFGVSDEVGAEIAEVTPVNFRQILSRARQDLYSFLRGECGLIDPANPCKCARKTRAYIQVGFVDPAKLQFTSGYVRAVREIAPSRSEELIETYMRVGADVYAHHPFYDPPAQVEKLRHALAGLSLGPS